MAKKPAKKPVPKKKSLKDKLNDAYTKMEKEEERPAKATGDCPCGGCK